MYDARFEPVSNRADWAVTFQIENEDTGEIITDLTGVSALVEVCPQPGQFYYWDYGWPTGLAPANYSYDTPVLSGSTDDGIITDLGDGVLEWHFTSDQMKAVCAGTYDLGLTLERDDFVFQAIIGVVPIVRGVVRR